MNDISVKNEILERIRKGKPAPAPLPDVPEYPWPGDPTEKFIAQLIVFDGRAIKFKTRDDAVSWFKSQPEADSSRMKIYSSVADIAGNVGAEDAKDPEKIAQINTCVTEAGLGVGETGSVWVTDKSLGVAACALLSRRIFALLDAKKIKGGLCEAYNSIRLGDSQYGSFFSGPSATADIEAVRITGAQGHLALTAMIYNCEDASEPPELIVSPNADVSPWVKEEEKE